MQDEYKITLLERFFDRHMMAVSDRIGLETPGRMPEMCKAVLSRLPVLQAFRC